MDIELEKKREAAYWRERFNIINDANSKMSQQTYNEVAHAFDLAQKDIQRDIDTWMNRFASNNGITLADAKKLLNSQELKEFKWDVWEYIKHGKQNAISGKWAKELENASAKYHISRLEALKMRIQNHFETAFAIENKAVDKLVKDVYKTGYYRTAFEFQKGSGIGFDVIGLDEKRLDTIAHKPWTTDRRTFSDRIWERKDQMVNNFHQNMIRNCAAGRSRKEMVKDLEQFVNKNVKNAKYCAARVVRTETASFSSRSQYESLLNLGCERYEISLTLTAASCPICQEMNGKSFKTSEYEVGATAPPFHPNCDNGTLIPIYDDDFFKDDPPEGAEEIPDNISYEEWEKKFVKDNDKGLTNSRGSDIMDMRGGRVEQAKTRDKKIEITDIAISKANPPLIPRFSAEQNARFKELHQELLRVALDMNDSNEVAFLFSPKTMTYEKAFGTVINVNIFENPIARDMYRMAAESELYLLHNHPSTKSFSYSDIGVLLMNENFGGITVVTNTGVCEVVYKNSNYDFEAAYDGLKEIRQEYDCAILNEEQDAEVVKRFLKIGKKFGVILL